MRCAHLVLPRTLLLKHIPTASISAFVASAPRSLPIVGSTSAGVDRCFAFCFCLYLSSGSGGDCLIHRGRHRVPMRERTALAFGTLSDLVEFAWIVVVKRAVLAGRALTLQVKFAEGVLLRGD